MTFRWGFETKKLSKTWAEFTEVLQPPTSLSNKAKPYVLCNHCRIILCHPNRNAQKSPSSMRKHLRGCTPYQKKATSSDNPTLLELFNSDRSPVMSGDRLKEKVLRVIVSGNLPFAFADNVEFQSLLKDAYPNCPAPTRKSAKDYLQSRADGTREDLKAKLAVNDSKVSLVLDAWTSRSSHSFLGTLSAFPLAVTG